MSKNSNTRRGGSRKYVWLLAVLVICFIIVSTLIIPKPDTQANNPATTASRAQETSAFASPIPYTTALTYAQNNVVAVPKPHGYHRDQQFGKWQKRPELCGTGTSRDFILQRDLTHVVMDSQCKVQSGDFHSPYTSENIHFVKGVQTSMQVQIDHIVAVQDAWASGLWQSSRAQERTVYYNDAEVLQASDAASNQAKGAGIDWKSPRNPVWLPDNQAWHCDYMAKRAYIKHKYTLTMSEAEKQQTVSILTSCATQHQ
jgi:hypothetical protein